MKLLVAALLQEARPFLERLDLKKHSFGHGLEFWLGKEYAILVTGTGRVPAAVRVARALQLPEMEGVGHVMNIGICGCADSRTPVGAAFLINKIEEAATGRTYFPDMLAKHPFAEAMLVTVDRPCVDGASELREPILYDMEAAGIFQAASAFVSVDRMHFLKVVSDHLEQGQLSKDAVENLLEAVADELLELVHCLPGWKVAEMLEHEEIAAQDNLRASLRLTETHSVQVRNLAIAYRLSGKTGLHEKLSKAALNLPNTSTKATRNAALKQLRHALGA